VFSFVTLDEIIVALHARGDARSLEFHVQSNLLDDDSTDPTSVGIPSHVLTDLECFRHSGHPDPYFSEMIKSISTSGRLALASNIDLCVPGEQKEDFNDSTRDKNTCGWRRPAGDPKN
jgi:hypothetical protein